MLYRNEQWFPDVNVVAASTSLSKEVDFSKVVMVFDPPLVCPGAVQVVA